MTAQQEIPTIDDGTQYAVIPIYQELEVNNSQSSATPNIYENVHRCYKNKTHWAIQKPGCRYSIFIASCLIFVVTAVIAAIVAAALTISLRANLQNDLKNFKQRLDQLETEFHSNLRQQGNATLGMIQRFGELRTNIRRLNDSFIQQIGHVANATSLAESVTTANKYSQTSIKTLTDILAIIIQALHTFNSCTDVLSFFIQLPSGMYRIGSGNSAMDKYCSTTFANSCNGIPGGWKRIAYLNTDEYPVSCPDGFEVRSDTYSPPLCRRMDTIAGCSSVIYPSNGMSYSQVCGTVRVHPEGTPDGFNTLASSSLYADGVSLTYGNSTNRNHIWTYTAAIFVNNNLECDICNYKRYAYPGNNFTCFTARCYDGVHCYPNTLWGSEPQQCFGNETFYRQLSESTTDNIEMRVCRDQGQSDEDILISYVELFVM